MRLPTNTAVVFALAWLAGATTPSPLAGQAPAWSADLTAVRRAAGTLPGPRPTGINVVKFAESRRTRNFAVKGAPAEPGVQARTAYQLVYPDSTVMIDAGMDRQVHRFFGRGVDEPYFQEAANAVERALLESRAIVVTHEHGDHVAGVIRSPRFAELAAKTVLTRTQVNTLLRDPQVPEIRLTTDMASHFVVIDDDQYHPFAPGVALARAPGHTPGSQMIYVVLQSGREYLFAGDVAWHMDGVRRITGKDAPWITEAGDEILAELTWLNGLMHTEPNLTIVISHDEEQRLAYIRDGLLGDGFK